MGTVQFLNPDGLHKNPAFTNVAVVSGAVRTIYIGGQNATDAEGNIVGSDLAAQTTQVFHNIQTAVEAAGGRVEDIIKWTLYVVPDQPMHEGFAAFQRFWGDRPNPPLISVLVVSALANPLFLIEMEAIAVVPE